MQMVLRGWSIGAVNLALAILTSRTAAGQICRPVSERTEEKGCWIIAHSSLGTLPSATIYWHVDSFPTREAALSARGPRGTVVESFGTVWLLTIDIATWRTRGGTHVASIGPLPIRAGSDFAAQYMEAVFTPGMTAPSHRHSGPEAWYTISGETCLETPEGKMIGRAGGPPVIVPEGPPMHLTAIGTETRRALVLILHDEHAPPTTPARDWMPKGLCLQ